MARTFQHFTVTFTRTVQQEQDVTVAVAPELDKATSETVAKQLATKRLNPKAWENAEEKPATITLVAEAEA